MAEAPSNAQTEGAVPAVVHRPSRLRALAALEANAESAADALDRITRVARRALGVPVALVNLIGSDRQRFLGCGGLPEPWASTREMPLTQGFCPFTLEADAPYAFADARDDPVLAANPAAQRGVIAYAGVPLRTAEGEAIGTLCAADDRPHAWSDEDLELLADLAGAALAELQLLATTRLLARSRARLGTLPALGREVAGAESAAAVLEAVLGAVARARTGVLWLPAGGDGQDGAALRLAAAVGPEAGRLGSAASGAAGAPAAARAGEPAYLASRAEVQAAFGLDAPPQAGSAAVLPLDAGGRSAGVLALCFADERPFAADDRDHLDAVAAVAGLAVARTPPLER